MTTQEDDLVREYQQEQFKRLTPTVRDAAIKALRENVPLEALNAVREEVAEDGTTWWYPHHDTLGEAVRGILRSSGIHDHLTPTGTLEDLWVPLIEVASGAVAEIATEDLAMQSLDHCPTCNLELVPWTERDQTKRKFGVEFLKCCVDCAMLYGYDLTQGRPLLPEENVGVGLTDQEMRTQQEKVQLQKEAEEKAARALAEAGGKSHIFVECDCYNHLLQLRYDTEDDWANGVDVSFYQYGHHGSRWDWRTRLKLIWLLITKGTIHSDMVIIPTKTLPRLINYLQNAHTALTRNEK